MSIQLLIVCLLSFNPLPLEEEPPQVVIRPKPVVTEHVIQLDGRDIEYTATAGTLPLYDEDDGKVEAQVFHVAYMKKGADPSKRPIFFLFNGGPGSSSVWLHLGAFGPKRVLTGDTGDLAKPPWRLAENDASLLDVADLVFIDPVSTGFSRAEQDVSHDRFHGVDQDAASVARFIRLFITRHDRWNSPKFIGGESYGTVRSAALARELQDGQGIYLNGILLVSSILDFGTVRTSGGNDLPHALFLPTMAAAAWYHGMVDRERFPDLESIVSDAEVFAIERFLPALAKGSSLGPDETDVMVRELHELTGLSEDVLRRCDLRVGPTRFRKELLRDKGIIIGRFDSRFNGPAVDESSNSPAYDPSYTAIVGPYTSTLNEYVRNDLGYRSDIPYEILTGNVQPWDYSRFQNRFVSVAGRLRDAVVKNPNLRVFQASGYFDLATPHFAADYVVDHMLLPEPFRKHVETKYYPAGHMMYLNDTLRVELSKDVRAWIEASKNTE